MGAFCLSAILAVSGPAAVWAGSPEFARTDEEWAALRDNVMEYKELPGLIHEYNVTVKKNQLDINDKKKDDKITNNDYAKYYRDAADDVRDSITGDNPVSDATYEVSAEKAEIQADQNVEDLTVYQLTYAKQEADLVAQAQRNMISYFQKQDELEAKKANLDLLNLEYQSAVTKAQPSVGLATQVDVLTAKENVQNAQADIQKQSADIEKIRQSLCIMLGWSYNDTPEIREIPAVDMERITAMNPETDKEAALNNNYTLKINKKKLGNAQADITKKTLERTIADNEQNIGSSLVKDYQEVLQSKAEYEQAAAEYNLEKKNLDKAVRNYQVGKISRLAYLKQQNTYQSKSIAVKTAELTLFQSVQTYENDLNGLASTGG
jgi:outer membrane protein TolC